jgi:hypothetical protein
MHRQRCGFDQQIFGAAEQGRSRDQTYLSDVRPSIYGEDNASCHFSHKGSQTALAVAARASPFGGWCDDFRRQGFADPPTPGRDRAEAGRHAGPATRVGKPHRHRLFGMSGKSSKERLKPVLSRLKASTRTLWPGLARPSTSFVLHESKTWMPGPRPGMTTYATPLTFSLHTCL